MLFRQASRCGFLCASDGKNLREHHSSPTNQRGRRSEIFRRRGLQTKCRCELDSKHRQYPNLFDSNKKDQATAWVLDELSAEDSRNSLEGLGIIRIEPTEFNEGFSNPKVQEIIARRVNYLNGNGLNWLTSEDYILFTKVCLELLRERNAIEVPEGVSSLRNNHEKRGNLVILGGDNVTSPKDTIQFAGTSISTTENKRSAFVRKYAKKVHGCVRYA